MRSKIRKDVVTRFTMHLKDRLPEFRPHAEDSDSPIWSWTVASNLTFFVMLQPLRKKDQFVLEIGWSDDGRFPWHILPSSLSRIEATALRGRLAELWATGPVADTWALVPDETDAELQEKITALEKGDMKKWLLQQPEKTLLPQVAPLVADAVKKLIDFGFPVFKKVADRQNISFPAP